MTVNPKRMALVIASSMKLATPVHYGEMFSMAVIPYAVFTFESVVGYAMSSGSLTDPVEAIEHAREHDQLMQWVSQHGGVLQVPKHVFNFGDLVIFEGNIFELANGNNRNIELIEVKDYEAKVKEWKALQPVHEKYFA